MNIVEQQIKKMHLEADAYHRLAEALERLRDFYHYYAEYLHRMADAKAAILEKEEER